LASCVIYKKEIRIPHLVHERPALSVVIMIGYLGVAGKNRRDAEQRHLNIQLSVYSIKKKLPTNYFPHSILHSAIIRTTEANNDLQTACFSMPRSLYLGHSGAVGPLVRPAVFKTVVPAFRVGRWVRFPHVPAFFYFHILKHSLISLWLIL
jgi:hypothetical protein